MNKDQSAFSVELRKLRKEARYTQQQLANLANISAAYISQLETGKKKPTDRVITKLCGPLDIPENRLLIKIGKVKMDLAATFSANRKDTMEIITNLTEEQRQELLTYLAYLRIKSSITV